MVVHHTIENDALVLNKILKVYLKSKSKPDRGSFPIHN